MTGFAISAAALLLAIRQLDVAVAQSLLVVDPALVLLSLLMVVFTTVAKALRWRLLLGRSSVVSFRAVLSYLVIGQTINNLFPVRLGELSRMYLAAKRCGVPASVSLASIALEKLADLFFLVLSLLLVSLLFVIPADFARPAALSITTGLLLFFVIVLVTSMEPSAMSALSKWANIVPWAAAEGVSRQLSGLRDLWREIGSPRTVVSVLIWSLVIWMLAVATNYLSLLAMGIDLPLVASLALLVTIHLGVAIPSAPGRIGVFQGATLLGLAPFGVSPTAAFTYSVLLHFIVFVPVSIAGCLLLWREQVSIWKIASSMTTRRETEGEVVRGAIRSGRQ